MAANAKNQKRLPLFSTREILVPNWENIPVGTKFIANIGDYEDVEGRIAKEPTVGIILCQNEPGLDGYGIQNRLGYDYSYSIGMGTFDRLLEEQVFFQSLELDPDFDEADYEGLTMVINDYQAYVYSTHIKVGCQEISFETFDELTRLVNLKRKK